MEDLITLIQGADARALALITIFARGVIRGQKEPGK